jgi:dissimilatory sulfite reductase (desulfoviridin) alpha/beta subunit
MTRQQGTSVAELRNRGIVKLRDEDMFALWIKTACCNLSSPQLKKVADIAEKYARSYLLFTTRQIPIIPFVHLKDVESVHEELSSVYLKLDRCGPTVRNVNVCYEDKICPEAVTNSLSLGEKLDNFFYTPMTHKVKLGVAGCRKDCIVSRALADVGFVGVQREGVTGYDVYVGGRLGLNPFLGVQMAESLSESECVRLVENYFDLLTKEGKPEERGADIINRLGVSRVKQELCKDLQQVTQVNPIECLSKLSDTAADTVIVGVRATCGEVTADQLRRIADIAGKYGEGFIHFTVRGAPEIPCVGKQHLDSIRQELDDVNLELLDRGIDNLQACFGNYCTESNADPQSLLKKIDKMVDELGLNNLDVKISASGCPNSCGIAHLNDIGFYGVVEPAVDDVECSGCGLCVPVCKRKAITVSDDVAVIDSSKCKYCGQCITVCPLNAVVEKRRGFAVLVGGGEGEDTQLGKVVVEFISEEEALEITRRCLSMLMERQSSATALIEEAGIEKFKQWLLPGVEVPSVTPK